MAGADLRFEMPGRRSLRNARLRVHHTAPRANEWAEFLAHGLAARRTEVARSAHRGRTQIAGDGAILSRDVAGGTAAVPSTTRFVINETRTGRRPSLRVVARLRTNR